MLCRGSCDDMVAIDGPEEQVCAQQLHVRDRAQRRRHIGVTAQASQETRQGLLTGVWGPKRVSVCPVALCSLKMVRCTFNG